MRFAGFRNVPFNTHEGHRTLVQPIPAVPGFASRGYYILQQSCFLVAVKHQREGSEHVQHGSIPAAWIEHIFAYKPFLYHGSTISVRRNH